VTFVVSFSDRRPPPRFPPLTGPWVTVRVEEAADPAGPWDPIATVPLDPLDADLARPGPRSVSSDQASLADGWYRLVWVDAAASEHPTPPVPGAWETSNAALWTPTVQDIADLCQAFTRGPVGEDGGETGSFDETTTPTATQVHGYIAAAVAEIAARMGGLAIPARAVRLAHRAAAWHAAAMVEAERAPSGGDETAGAHSWKQSSYVACLKALDAETRPAVMGIG
jgi:hypothetical protein